jgi:oligopeptide/dipeptide ABC transporter ATP-binding protein
LDGKSVLDLNPRALRALRRKTISYIFQEPSSSLNPVFRIGAQIAEAVHLRVDSKKETDVASEVLELLDQVGIPDPASAAKRYPHELSGGMQQRVMIAMALAGKPDILVADEPTTALDVTIQAQILELLARVNRETGMAIILVTHNLGIVADMANRVVVMYAGRAVEATETKRLLATPAHPYTRALLSAVPKLGHARETLPTIPGNVPSPADFPLGCRFHGRCQEELALQESSICSTNVPEWREIEKGHYAACHCLK